MAELRRFAHAQDVAQAAADEFVRLARRAISARGRFAVALSGGSTPRATYELLAGPSQLSQLDGSKIDWFWGDERAVPPDHPASNFRMASDALLSKLPLQTSRIHRIEIGQRLIHRLITKSSQSCPGQSSQSTLLTLA